MADHQDYTDQRKLKVSREGDYLLIDLVRQNPHLYNKDLKDFKDIEKREQTWREISSMLNLNGRFQNNNTFLYKLKRI